MQEGSPSSPESIDLPRPARWPFSISEHNSGSLSIVHRLGREIVGGKYSPGDRLPDEAAMLKRFAVSRTALREAYSRLAAKGMIIARPKVGTSVRPASFWNMLDPDVLAWHLETKPVEEIARDLYTLRRMLEPSAAAFAASLRTPEELVEIEDAYAAMKATSNEVENLVESDLRFHVAILDATHNYFIGAFSSLIYAGMLTTFQLTWRAAAATVIRQDRLLQHGQVLDAIREQNPEKARACMEALIDDSLEDVSGSLVSAN